MEFFERQDDSRRNTVFLAVIMLAGSLCVALAGAAIAVFLIAAHDPILQERWQGIAVFVSLSILALIALVASIERLRLGKSADALPRQLGAVPLTDNHPNAERLNNVVHEMAIAALVPNPDVLVLENESGIDAFAAGLSPQSASVTVSRGCLEKLSRDELQAVIAHEFSHIVNDDIAVNLRLTCLTRGLSVFGDTAKSIIRFVLRYAPGKAKFPLTWFAVIFTSPLWFMGVFGSLFCRIMKAGISRQREYLADASAIQYTRQTSGLVGALRKARQHRRSRRSFRKAGHELVSHMLFVGRPRGWFSLFATHPRIEKRIRLAERAYAEA